jgi:hypothetical protein
MNRIEGRTALILFSDGVDNDSPKRRLSKARCERSKRSDTLIYPVQFSTYDRMKSRTPAPSISAGGRHRGFSEQDYRRAGAYLRRLADTTSTGVYPAAEISDLDHAISSIVDELHNEYSIGYYPRDAGRSGEQKRVRSARESSATWWFAHALVYSRSDRALCAHCEHAARVNASRS